MTWGEWCDSDYNINNRFMAEGAPYYEILDTTTSNKYVACIIPEISSDYTFMKATDTIISGQEYTTRK